MATLSDCTQKPDVSSFSFVFLTSGKGTLVNSRKPARLLEWDEKDN